MAVKIKLKTAKENTMTWNGRSTIGPQMLQSLSFFLSTMVCRIISSASNEPAYFRGEENFSFQFWEQIFLRDGNLGSAFSGAADIMRGYQKALINANGNILANEAEDFTIANGIIIRRAQPIYVKPAPMIGNVADSQTLNGSSSAVIRVSDVLEAESVWAKIIPPDINPDVDGVPITDLDTIELQDTNHDGTYDVYYVKLSNGNTAFGKNCTYDLKLYRPIGPLAGFASGLVKDAITQLTLADVKIKTDLDQTTLGLSNGSYLMVHPAGSSFSITAEKPGYFSKVVAGIAISEGESTALDLTLAPVDTDGDGIPDLVEDASDCLVASDADTDDDCIPDGVEDANHNGSIDTGEAIPAVSDLAKPNTMPWLPLMLLDE
jgi:hypothetical protein